MRDNKGISLLGIFRYQVKTIILVLPVVAFQLCYHFVSVFKATVQNTVNFVFNGNWTFTQLNDIILLLTIVYVLVVAIPLIIKSLSKNEDVSLIELESNEELDILNYELMIRNAELKTAEATIERKSESYLILKNLYDVKLSNMERSVASPDQRSLFKREAAILSKELELSEGMMLMRQMNKMLLDQEVG